MPSAIPLSTVTRKIPLSLPHRLLNRIQASWAQHSSSLFLLICAVVYLLIGPDSSIAQHNIRYNDARLLGAINAILSYLEGSFGALVMACAGITAILSAAFGQYKASLGLLVIAVGSFILRSLMGTFFNDVGIQP